MMSAGQTRTRSRHRPLAAGLAAAFVLALPLSAAAQAIPALTVTGTPETATWSLSLQIVALMTALTVLPSLLLGLTAFTRIIIVLSILRQALGTQQTPPNQVLIALALFVTFFVMQPTFLQVYEQAIAPLLDGKMAEAEAFARGSEIFRTFMLGNVRQNDLAMFAELAGDGPYASPQDVPFRVLLPAFMTSELKTAFQIGFMLFLPFLVIDIVIASVLMALGMMMVSPVLVALPFKLLLFVLVDGWALTVGSLAAGYGLGG
jgi:flagellar biosynthetic protein FliP